MEYLDCLRDASRNLKCLFALSMFGFTWPVMSIADTDILFDGQKNAIKEASEYFYVCYPENWTKESVSWFESHYFLDKKHELFDGKVSVYKESDVESATQLASYFKHQSALDCVSPIYKVQMTKKSLNDTYFSYQWFLNGSGGANADISTVGAWDYATGDGVVIGILDDGVEIRHSDLIGNVVSGLSWDFVDGDSDPTNLEHGTAVAGVAAAVGNNNQGVAGVAYDAGLVGLRLLDDQGYIVESDVAAAMQYQLQNIDVANNSWGPPDGDSGAFLGPSQLELTAFERAISEGRNGLGRIIVWAGGNGGDNDNSNLDGYAGSRYTIAVTASTDQGIAAGYAETGANLLITAPSSGGSEGVTTTDRSGASGYNNGSSSWNYSNASYTNDFGGTSSATPVISGVVALMLEANPNLGWRDVQAILAASAQQLDSSHSDWQYNGAGYSINEQYGYGLVNAEEAVKLASGWGENTSDEVSSKYYSKSVSRSIPDNNPNGSSASIRVDENLRVQHVEVTVDVSDHTYWGDLEFELTSPQGVTTKLIHSRVLESVAALSKGYDNWTMTDSLRLGELSKGIWTLRVRDAAEVDVGTFSSWGLKIYGTEIPNYANQLSYQCQSVSLVADSKSFDSVRFRFGASRHGSPYGIKQTLSQSEDIDIRLGVIGAQTSDQFVTLVQYVNPQDGASIWLMRTANGYIPWGGNLAGLASFESSSLFSGDVISLFSGHLPPGDLYLFMGIKRGDEIGYCPTPMEIVIR